MKTLVPLCALVALGAACRAAPDTGSIEPPPSSVVILDQSIVLKSGPIGVEDRQDATWAYVDVENRSAEPRLVSVEGDLLDAAGKTLGPLMVDELYVPAGEKRTFAVVAGKVYPDATRAKLHVHYAPVAKDKPVVVVNETKVRRAGIPLTCTPALENLAEKELVATVYCTFYDKDGKILARPFQILGLLPRSTRSYTFDGPAEAVTATAFIGQVVI